jgi:hypothetical protein
LFPESLHFYLCMRWASCSLKVYVFFLLPLHALLQMLLCIFSLGAQSEFNASACVSFYILLCELFSNSCALSFYWAACGSGASFRLDFIQLRRQPPLSLLNQTYLSSLFVYAEFFGLTSVNYHRILLCLVGVSILDSQLNLSFIQLVE